MKLDEPLTGAAIRQNLEHFTEAIHRFVVKRLGRSQQIEDIAQEVHVRLLKIDDSRLVENPLSYIYGITHHVIVDVTTIEANRFNGGAVPIETLTASELEEQPSLKVSDSSDHLNLQQQIELALATLPPDRAEVILCLKAHGMSYDKTAKHLGLTLGQVRHHIFEAKKHLMNLQWDR